MKKVLIASHRSEVTQLLEDLQAAGLCQILNAEEAQIAKDWPELGGAIEQPRDIEELLGRLSKSIRFLEGFCEKSKGLASILSGRCVIDEQSYRKAISNKEILEIVSQCEQTESQIDKLRVDIENLEETLHKLQPWHNLEVPVEELGGLSRTFSLAGMIPTQHIAQAEQQTVELGGAIQRVGISNNQYACIIVGRKDELPELQKMLRSLDFEVFSFESMAGTAAQLSTQTKNKLDQAVKQLNQNFQKATELTESLLELKILHDHYSNLLSREQTKGTAPATEQTVILEGWVKRKDYPQLEKVVSEFGASSLSEIEAGEDEEIPVEIENNRAFRPFEVVTRLYGMPQHYNVDPTAFLAPFFALFFALCLTDAGYGLLLIALIAVFIKKMQGDKKLMWMLGFCGVFTIFAGALTGGWFGDAVQQFIPALSPFREKMMWFDPLENPMFFFKLSLSLGYIQILTGLFIAFFHNIRQKDYAAAAFDQLTWLVMLNLIVICIFVGGKAGRISGLMALFPAILILLFSHHQGSWGGRIGMGLYNLFSAVFYMGDVLSYLRLMALGMVTAGMAMATNIIAKIIPDILSTAIGIPYSIGVVVAIVILIGGHTFNMLFSALSAFVHTLRLQYAEFFPKFFEGDGKLFEPLSKQYRHIYIKGS
ncbi:MAG: hypothetical protein JXB29_05930 [Sedimentisphaerales bacterium]|nr:hypothetical protein [Sedimentisphaerales bacterium]